jgi:hypothetical protein
MSYRVIVKGTPNARLVDVECHRCGLLLEDVWRDEIEPECPECNATEMVEVFRSAPMIDFRNTSPIRIPGVKGKFESHREMERWAANYRDPQTGEHKPKTVIPNAREFEMLPVDTPEERIEKANGPKRREAIAKAKYKLQHGLT